jgi:LuxR family maltose regulon positive regulatory protein
MIELLRTKLFIPRPRKNLVSRPRLIDCLNTGSEKKLTLIAAPAGFGKTTLLSEWIPQSPRCVTWLSLDQGDDDPVRFWTYFISSLQELRSDLGRSALARLQSPQASPIASILTTLLNEMTEFPDRFAIVLDDYHTVESQQIHDALTFLVDHLPGNMHLVLTTRVDPPIPLARLRAQDQLVELRASDLRFGLNETDSFLNRAMGLNLSSTEVLALETRTEGWIAGLQIAALSLQDHTDVSGFIRTFSGSHRHILGYLADEVLNQCSEETLNFLLHTSILDRMCGPLCEAVTGQSGSQRMLEALEHANLFIMPLDEECKWYRYHHLFTEVLQQRLHKLHPNQLSELYQRASLWHEQEGLMAEAVNYAMAARDFDRVADLVEAVGITLFAQPAIQSSLQGWLAALPAEVVRSRPRLNLIRAWQHFDQSDISAAIRFVNEAELLVESPHTDIEVRDVQNITGSIAAMRAFLYTFTRDPDLDQVMNWAKTALTGLELDRSSFRGLAAAALAFVYVYRGGLAEVERASSQAAEAAQAAGNVYLATFATVTRILIMRAMGQYRNATALCRQALEWMTDHNAYDSPSMSALNTALADLLRETNHLEEARHYAELSLRQADHGSNPAQVLFCRFALARVKQAQGDWDDASDLLAQVSARLPKDSPMLHPAMIDAASAQWQIMRGHLAPALHWAQATDWEEVSLASIRTSSDLVWRCEHLWIARAQVLIAHGRAAGNHSLLEEVQSQLKRQQASAEAIGLIWLQTKLIVLQAAAGHALGDTLQATACLQQALSLAESEGYMRVFVDEGEPMQRLLTELRADNKSQIANSLNNESHILAYLDKLLAAFRQPVSTDRSKDGVIVEPLSERELDILRLIATGRSNQEIADVLVIAVSTVKTHINNLYSKLGTNRRTEAIATARKMGLLTE